MLRSSSSDSDVVEERLDRHDRRRLSEAYYSVQSGAAEMRKYFDVVVAPSDGTSRDVVEMLSASSKEDADTLLRAVRALNDVAASMTHYETLSSRADAVRMSAWMLDDSKDVLLAMEQTLIVLAAGQLDAATATMLAEAREHAATCRRIAQNGEQVCAAFGVAAQGAEATLTAFDDDDDDSFDSDHSSEDEAKETMLATDADFFDVVDTWVIGGGDDEQASP